MRGRPPKTTEQHKADGTYQPVRHAKRLNLPAISEAPPPPADFDEAHKIAWVAFCETMKQHGILTGADHYAIRTFVESEVTAKTTYAILLAEGFMQDGRKHPLHMVYAEAVKTMRALYDQFGLTPRSRMNLKVEKPKQEDESPFERMIRESKLHA